MDITSSNTTKREERGDRPDIKTQEDTPGNFARGAPTGRARGERPIARENKRISM